MNTKTTRGTLSSRTDDSIKILTFSSLYPNAAQPSHGIFVEQRLRHLLASGQVESRVVAPVPWFPFKGRRWGRYGVLAAVPAREARHGIDVVHPRYPVIPKVGMSVAPQLMAMAVEPVLRRMIAEGYDFDLIDAHYFYPDGVAASILARRLNKPLTITARGTDINLIAKYPGPRRQMLQAAETASKVITVSDALRRALIDIGVDDRKIDVLRNGVDLTLFKPLKRLKLRQEMNVRGTTLLSVGNLVVGKGHHVVIEAMAALTDMNLIIVGHGPMRDILHAQAQELGVSDRVKFTGSVDHEKLCRYYNIADALVLASEREGMPNVVLESLACGTPVVATAVGGIPEVVSSPDAGRLMDDRTAESVAGAVSALLLDYPDCSATRCHAERFDWRETTDGQMGIFSGILSSRRASDVLHAGVSSELGME